MNKATYEQHKETLASGRIVIVGGRTAATVEQLDQLREIELRQAGQDTARGEVESEVAEAERTAGGEQLAEADVTQVATAAQLSTGARDNVSPKTIHDNGTGEAVISEGEIAAQAGTERTATSRTRSRAASPVTPPLA